MCIPLVKEGSDNVDAPLTDQFVRPPVIIFSADSEGFHRTLPYIRQGAADSIEKVSGNILSYL
jgi:hypothetical protein